MLDILCSETAYLSHMYEFWNITSMSWGGERESNKVLSTDLAEWHQEAEQRWYLDTQQCHRGSHLLCVFVCIRVRVCSPICCVHPGDISSSSSNSLTYTHIYTHTETEKQAGGGWVHRNKFTDCVYDETVIIKHLCKNSSVRAVNKNAAAALELVQSVSLPTFLQGRCNNV